MYFVTRIRAKTFYYDDINQKTGINTGGTIS